MDEQVLTELESHAKKQHISLNTFVNQIFHGYVSWEIDAIPAGWSVLHKNALVLLGKHTDEKTMSEIGKQTASSIVKDVVLYMRGKHDLHAWLSVMLERAKRSGFNVIKKESERVITLIIQHDIGKKWSLFFKSYYQESLHDLGVPVSFDYTENTIVVHITKPASIDDGERHSRKHGNHA